MEEAGQPYAHLFKSELHEIRTMHEAIGRAFITWQEVESATFKVFWRLVPSLEERIAQAIFFSPREFSEKLKTTHNVARLTLKKYSLLDDWTPLRKRLLDRSKDRNKLAHFGLTHLTKIDLSGTVIADKMILHPNFLDITEALAEEGKSQAEKDEELDIPTIVGYIEKFTELTADAHSFAEKIPQP